MTGVFFTGVSHYRYTYASFGPTTVAANGNLLDLKYYELVNRRNTEYCSGQWTAFALTVKYRAAVRCQNIRVKRLYSQVWS